MTDSNFRYGIAEYARVLKYDDGRKDRIEPFYMVVREDDRNRRSYLYTYDNLYAFCVIVENGVQFDTKDEALMELKAFLYSDKPKIEWQDDAK